MTIERIIAMIGVAIKKPTIPNKLPNKVKPKSMMH